MTESRRHPEVLHAQTVLPRHALKVDKSFVLDMAGDGRDAVMADSTVDRACSPGYCAVTECVEDEGAGNPLAIFGADRVQGQHIGCPAEPGSRRYGFAHFSARHDIRQRQTAPANLEELLNNARD